MNIGNIFHPIIVDDNKINKFAEGDWKKIPGIGLEQHQVFENDGKKFSVVALQERHLDWSSSGTRWLALAATIFSFGIAAFFNEDIKQVLFGKQVRHIVQEQQSPSEKKVQAVVEPTLASPLVTTEPIKKEQPAPPQAEKTPQVSTPAAPPKPLKDVQREAFASELDKVLDSLTIAPENKDEIRKTIVNSFENDSLGQFTRVVRNKIGPFAGTKGPSNDIFDAHDKAKKIK